MESGKTVAPSDDDRVHIILFKPEDLYVPRSPFTFFSGARRTIVSGTWEDFTKVFSRSCPGDPTRYADPNIAKRARGGWVPGRYKSGTGHGNLAADFLSTEMIVVDVDAGDPHAVAVVLSGYEAFVHSTYKHTPSAPRCRAVLRLDRPCTSAKSYNTGLKSIAAVLSSQGFVAPAKDSTLGKLAYLPMHQPGVEPVFIVARGRPLDLDRIVAAEGQHCHHANAKRTSSARSQSYAKGALRRASERVGSAHGGERHNVLYAEAASLGRPELDLNEQAIEDALAPAARHADPHERPEEHERTIRDGIRRSRGT